MKRIKSACIFQTLIFAQKPELELNKQDALKINHDEIERYKSAMDRAKTRYQIVSVEDQDDGSVIVRVKKQYTDKTDVSEYFD
ncbi:MAG: hypothetical protein E7344_03205 [Clostridiales bacterium]|nr:hypothetical protein [Clostridiales bacterium]